METHPNLARDMLFLMNDLVISLDGAALGHGLGKAQLERLGLQTVIGMEKELFAKEPKLQHTGLERARRLATLIYAASPKVNAALFLAPKANCDPRQVSVRLLDVGFEVIGGLYALQKRGGLDTMKVHQAVWMRQAA